MPIERCDVTEVLCKSPEPHETCAQSTGVLGSSTSHLSHDDHRARQRHMRECIPRKARAGAFVTHHPAWAGHHTGESRSTHYTRAHHGGKAVLHFDSDELAHVFFTILERLPLFLRCGAASLPPPGGSAFAFPLGVGLPSWRMATPSPKRKEKDGQPQHQEASKPQEGRPTAIPRRKVSPTATPPKRREEAPPPKRTRGGNLQSSNTKLPWVVLHSHSSPVWCRSSVLGGVACFHPTFVLVVLLSCSSLGDKTRNHHKERRPKRRWKLRRKKNHENKETNTSTVFSNQRKVAD